jgi:tetratricopeptide (TPR) repeat protein
MTESSGTGAGHNLTEVGAVEGGDLATAAAQLEQLLERDRDMSSRLALVQPLYRALMAATDAEGDAAIEVLLSTKSVLHQLIVVALIAGDLEEANRWCDRLITRYSGDYQSLLLKSTVQEFRQDYPGALATSDLLVELAPQDTSAHLRRALMLFAGGIADALPGGATEAFRQALAELDTVIRLDPTSTRGYLARARTYLALEQPDRAVEDYTAALQVDPTLVDAYRERARIHEEHRQFDLDAARAGRRHGLGQTCRRPAGPLRRRRRDLGLRPCDRAEPAARRRPHRPRPGL